MKVRDLYLGEVEGFREFSNKDRVDNLYFRGIEPDDITKLLNGNKRYIHGYKGTGKTSLIKVLEYECNNRHIKYASISYKKIRDDAELVNELRKKFNIFKDDINKEHDKEIIILTFWRWYLLSLVAKTFLNIDHTNLIYSTKQRIFRKLSSIIDMLVFGININGIKLSIQTTNTNTDDDIENIDKAAQCIRVLEHNISNKLEHKVILFIDELELTKARGTYGIDRLMIKGLLLATQYINEISNNLHIILAVRDEVVYDLRGDEINKLRDDFGVELSWWTRTSITVDHALWRLMFKKMRYSMVGKENHDTLSDKALWDRWFPFTIDGTKSWKFLFNLTWARPRDFVRLLKRMQDQCMDSNHFTRESYDLAASTYSKGQLSEISEEISTIFDDECMKKIRFTIQQLGQNFKRDQFCTEARAHNLLDPITVLEEMYRVGFIGNHYKDPRTTKWRFFYRKDEIPDFSKTLEVHKALHQALGIKDRFNQAVYYS